MFNINFIVNISKLLKSSCFNGRAINRGGGVKGQAIKEKITFLGTFFSNFQRSNGH